MEDARQHGPVTCARCGTCCIAPDISTLRKPLGMPCRHLRPDRLCAIYAHRPPVCREYRPDALCEAMRQIADEGERVRCYLAWYGLLDAVPDTNRDLRKES